MAHSQQRRQQLALFRRASCGGYDFAGHCRDRAHARVLACRERRPGVEYDVCDLSGVVLERFETTPPRTMRVQTSRRIWRRVTAIDIVTLWPAPPDEAETGDVAPAVLTRARRAAK